MNSKCAMRGEIDNLRLPQRLQSRAGGPTNPLPVAQATGDVSKIIKARKGRHIRSRQNVSARWPYEMPAACKPGLISPGKGCVDPSGLHCKYCTWI